MIKNIILTLSLDKIMRNATLLFMLCLTPAAMAWNATGHMLVAQIAYEQLTPQARQAIDALMAATADDYPDSPDFITASVWADDIRAQGELATRHWHYLNLAMDEKGRALDKPYQNENVAWAVDHSFYILINLHATDETLAIALRGLLHWVGDVHQPLHVVSRYSTEQPRGDRGGNLFKLSSEASHDNLHRLWDAGLGCLPYVRRPLDAGAEQWLQDTAKAWQAQVVVTPEQLNETDPMQWAWEGFALAKTHVYADISEGGVPDEAYIQRGQALTQQQIVLAGQRLAKLLNTIYARRAAQ